MQGTLKSSTTCLSRFRRANGLYKLACVTRKEGCHLAACQAQPYHIAALPFYPSMRALALILVTRQNTTQTQIEDNTPCFAKGGL